jgi:hypothetical protein
MLFFVDRQLRCFPGRYTNSELDDIVEAGSLQHAERYRRTISACAMDDKAPVAWQFTDAFGEVIQRNVDAADAVARPPFLRFSSRRARVRETPGRSPQSSSRISGRLFESSRGCGPRSRPASENKTSAGRGKLIGLTRYLAPTKNKELGTRHHVSQVPIANRLRSVRMYQRPSTSAGDASVYSPSRLT